MMRLSKSIFIPYRIYDRFFWAVNIGGRGFSYHKDIDLYKVLQVVVYIDFREPLRYGVGARRIAEARSLIRSHYVELV